MKIQQDISLKNKNWFKTGGNSKYYCQPETEKDFVDAIDFANQNKLEIFMLGKGANILISDQGFDGLTINLQNKISEENTQPSPKAMAGTASVETFNVIKITNETVTAGAGVEIQDLIDHCLNNNIIGLEDFSNIPGTIGGATYINIHYFDKFLSDFLISAKVINKKTSKVISVDKNWFNFGYDQSTLQKKECFLLNATFKLKKADDLQTAYAKGRRDEIIRYRTRQYPTQNTCGSFFRNFNENEVTLKVNDKKMIFVAYYLDKLGIKGNLKIGNAQVSYKHANMIVTNNNATSDDVIKLAQKIQELTIKNFGVLPQAECQFVGFKNYPLLKIRKKHLMFKNKQHLYNDNHPHLQ